MQRTVVIIRHAKSSWANPLQSDFERPLNERGNADAPMMGERLKTMGVLPDLIIASTAKRTKQTARIIAEAVGYDEGKIKWEEKLYHCIPSVIEEAIFEVSDDIKTIFIVAHNPGITGFANQMDSKFYIDNMPTCSVVGAHLEAAEWSGYSIAEKKVFLFEYPKKGHDN